MGARENLMAKLNVDNEQLNEIIKKKMAEKKCSATQALILLANEAAGKTTPMQEKVVPRGVDFDTPPHDNRATISKGMFHKAQRKESKLRLALTGASGSGKTYSALMLAMGLGGSIAVADTERGSAALYSHLFDFDTVEIEPPYQIKKWIDIFDSAVESNYNVLILDSITPLWSGEGGLLEMKEQLSKHSGKNSFTAWADVTPLYNKFVERMLNANIHIIATIRAKAEYAMETDGGRTVVKKIGLGPQFRDGIDYEFTTVFDIASDHSALVSKDRSGLFDAKTPFVIGKETGQKIGKWLEGKQ
mgnify:FL=1